MCALGTGQGRRRMIQVGRALLPGWRGKSEPVNRPAFRYLWAEVLAAHHLANFPLLDLVRSQMRELPEPTGDRAHGMLCHGELRRSQPHR